MTKDKHSSLLRKFINYTKKVYNIGPSHQNLTIFQLLNKKLLLSSSFRCDQIHSCQRHNFGPTLLCYFSQTLVFNSPLSFGRSQTLSYTKLIFKMSFLETKTSKETYLSVCLSIYLSIYLSIHLSIYLPIYLSVCLSI